MSKKDKRQQVSLSEDEVKQLDSLRAQKGHGSRSETLRYCFLQVVDNEGDAIGSRRHFSKTMNRRLDELSQQTAMYHEAMFIALTELFSVLLVLLNDGKASEATDPEKMRVQLIEKAFSEMTKVMSMFKTLNLNRVKREVALKKARRQQHQQKTSVTSEVDHQAE
ncbi:MAG: hypothetical protein AAF846_30030 [Chloroflexota bacterium]